MVKEIKDYLKQYEGFADKEIIIDYMPSQTGTFCLKAKKFEPVCGKYVDGGVVKQHVCTLCMREAYTFDNRRNEKNTSLLEGLICWLEEQDKKSNYPSGYDFVKVEAVSGIYIISNDVSTAEYAVDIRFIYREN